MNFFYVNILLFCFTTKTISVDLVGNLILGPEFSYQYKIIDPNGREKQGGFVNEARDTVSRNNIARRDRDTIISRAKDNRSKKRLFRVKESSDLSDDVVYLKHLQQENDSSVSLETYTKKDDLSEEYLSERPGTRIIHDSDVYVSDKSSSGESSDERGDLRIAGKKNSKETTSATNKPTQKIKSPDQLIQKWISNFDKDIIDHSQIETETEAVKTEAIIDPGKNIFIRTKEMSKFEPAKKIYNYTLQTSINMFSKLKAEAGTDDKTVGLLDLMQRAYETQFKKFYDIMQRQKIKTRLGKKRAILNTVDHSKNILEKLGDALKAKIKKQGALRGGILVAQDYNDNVNENKKKILNHLCAEYSICVPTYGYSDFLDEFLKNFIELNGKFTKAWNSFTEASKNANYDAFLQPSTKKYLKASIERLEQRSKKEIKQKLNNIRKVIQHRHMSYLITRLAQDRQVVNSTVAFLEIIDQLELSNPATGENLVKWKDYCDKIEKWIAGDIIDIQSLLEDIVNDCVENLREMKNEDKDRFSQNTKIFLQRGVDTIL